MSNGPKNSAQSLDLNEVNRHIIIITGLQLFSLFDSQQAATVYTCISTFVFVRIWVCVHHQWAAFGDFRLALMGCMRSMCLRCTCVGRYLIHITFGSTFGIVLIRIWRYLIPCFPPSFCCCDSYANCANVEWKPKMSLGPCCALLNIAQPLKQKHHIPH